MKLDTEFEIGETLWYLRNGKVYEVELYSISVGVCNNGTNNPLLLLWSAKMSFKDADGRNMDEQPLKKDLFRSKENAGIELLKRAGFDCKVVLS